MAKSRNKKSVAPLNIRSKESRFSRTSTAAFFIRKGVYDIFIFPLMDRASDVDQFTSAFHKLCELSNERKLSVREMIRNFRRQCPFCPRSSTNRSQSRTGGIHDHHIRFFL